MNTPQSPEVRRHRLKQMLSARRAARDVQDAALRLRLEAEIAGQSIRRMSAALRAGERQMLLEEMLNHPDLATFEAYAFDWYEDRERPR